MFTTLSMSELRLPLVLKESTRTAADLQNIRPNLDLAVRLAKHEVFFSSMSRK